jgi:hypothetical protein
MTAKTKPVAAVAAPVAAAAETTVAGKVRVAPELTEIRTDIAIPRKRRGGVASFYDFDSLNTIGASLGVKNKTAAQISSIVSKENKRHVTEMVDPIDSTKKVKTYSKKFEVFDVDASTDPDGAKCRIFRTQ